MKLIKWLVSGTVLALAGLVLGLGLIFHEPPRCDRQIHSEWRDGIETVRCRNVGIGLVELQR